MECDSPTQQHVVNCVCEEEKGDDSSPIGPVKPNYQSVEEYRRSTDDGVSGYEAGCEVRGYTLVNVGSVFVRWGYLSDAHVVILHGLLYTV